MKTKLVLAITVGVVALFSLGCSSVASRSKARQAKLYPGVRHSLDAGVSGGTANASASAGVSDPNGALAYVWWADLLLSAGVDTVLVPFDLAYKPSISEPPKYTQGVYHGLYRFGREQSDFTPLGSRERWWLTGDLGELTRRMARPSREQSAELRNPVSLVVEGELSEPGHYGHLDAYRRELRVTRILEAKQMSPEEPQ